MGCWEERITCGEGGGRGSRLRVLVCWEVLAACSTWSCCTLHSDVPKAQSSRARAAHPEGGDVPRSLFGHSFGSRSPVKSQPSFVSFRARPTSFCCTGCRLAPPHHHMAVPCTVQL